MGVTFVYQLPEVSGRHGSVTLAEVQKLLEGMGAQKVGACRVDSEPFYPTVSMGQKTLHLCHSSEFPATSFAVLGDQPGSVAYLAADNSFDGLVQKLQGAYHSKPNSKMEFQGLKYSVADFYVKFGAASVGSNCRGYLVEVEYRPCASLKLCVDLMKEFCTLLLGPTIAANPPAYLARKLESCKPGDLCSFVPIDTINQYVEFFILFRRISATPTPPTQKSL